MIEELKLVVEVLKEATDSALYAFLGLGIYNLLKISLIVFPIINLIKFTINKVFIDENSKDK